MGLNGNILHASEGWASVALLLSISVLIFAAAVFPSALQMCVKMFDIGDDCV